LDGYQLVTWNLLRELSCRHEFHLLAFDEGHDESRIAACRRYAQSVRVISHAGTSSFGSLDRRIRARLTTLPSDVLRLATDGVRSAILRALDRDGYDLAYLAAPALAIHAPALFKRVPLVIAPLDARTRQIPELAKAHRNAFLRLQSREQYHKSRAFESRYYLHSDRCVVVSERDRQTLLELNPDIKVEVIRLGVDDVRWRDIEPSVLRPVHDYDLAFSGNLNYDPNNEAALALVKLLLPSVKRHRAGTTLELVGARPSAALQKAVRDDSSVNLTGFVPDLGAEIARANVYVCPVQNGSGIRVKIMEAMAAGLPVVTYPVNIEELPVEHGVHLMIAGSPGEFVRHTLTLLQQPEMRKRLGLNARRLMMEEFSWLRSVARLDAILVQAASEGRRRLTRDPCSLPPRRIRVMQVVDQLSGGGAETLVREIARNLDRTRFEPSVCVTRRFNQDIDIAAELGVPVYCLRRAGRFDLRGFIRLVKLLRRERPDVVHCHKTGSNTLGRLAALMAGVPCIIAHEHTMPERGRVQRWLDRELARRTALVLACDRALRSALVRLEGLTPGKVRVANNGVDTSRFYPDESRRISARAALGVADQPVVGIFARLESQKDIPNLLAAAQLVHQEMPDTMFLLVGDGPLRIQLEQLSLALGLRAVVRFLGFRRDTPDLMRAVDVVALSSVWEGMPVSVLEAMASAKPLVATDVGSVSDAVVNLETGLLVPPRSPQLLARALLSLLRNPEARQAMGQAGRQRVEKQFTLQAMVSGIEQVYVEFTSLRNVGPVRLVRRVGHSCRVMLVGPYPPPEHGTSIPFRHMVQFLGKNSTADIVVVNSESGEKEGVPLLSWRVLRSFVSLTSQFLGRVGSCSHVVVYGSQRFAASAGALYALVAGRLLRKEVAIYIQGGAFDRYFQSLGGVMRLLVKLGFRSARAVGVQTRLVQTALAREFPNVVTIPNWTNTQPAPSIAGAQPNDGKVRFAFVGDVVRAKGVVELVEAFSQVLDALELPVRRLELSIYGPVKDDALVSVARLLDEHSDSIFVRGPVAHERLLSELKSHDVLILPTRWSSEGYPGVILEAMALGLPVIATRFRAIPEIVRDRENGLLCEPGDCESLAKCIREMALDRELRLRLGAQARRSARRFDVLEVMPLLCQACGIPLRQPCPA
jgi:glycosyltransferase involved in cell wall biosynthesis